MTRQVRENRNKRSGNALIEFALVSVFIIPLLLGTFVLGMGLGRSIQATQVSRDAGHMYVRFVDFTQTANQDLIVRLAQGLNMTRTGGNGVVILSKVTYIGDAECAAGGFPVGDTRCANRYQDVFIQQIIIGNPSARTSAFGTPTGATYDSSQNITNYLTNVGGRATNFSPVLALQSGEFGYVSESYFTLPELDLPGFRTGNAVYSRTIF